VKGQGAKINKCACDPPDVDTHVFTEVTEVPVAVIGMAKLSKIFFPQTSTFHLCSFSSYYSYSHFFPTPHTFFFLIIPNPAILKGPHNRKERDEYSL